jgi:hypothetical protein
MTEPEPRIYVDSSTPVEFAGDDTLSLSLVSIVGTDANALSSVRLRIGDENNLPSQLLSLGKVDVDGSIMFGPVAAEPNPLIQLCAADAKLEKPDIYQPLIKQLGGDFRSRQAAEEALAAAGPAAIPALKAALDARPPIDVLKRVERLMQGADKHELRQLIEQTTPHAVSDRLDALMKADRLDPEKILSYGKAAAPFLLRELEMLSHEQDAAGLKDERAKQLTGMLKQMGTEAAPALFKVVDMPGAKKELKELAKQLLDSMTTDADPKTWLYDFRGNLRRAGRDVKVDYDYFGNVDGFTIGQDRFKLEDGCLMEGLVTKDGKPLLDKDGKPEFIDVTGITGALHGIEGDYRLFVKPAAGSSVIEVIADTGRTEYVLRQHRLR